jgi:uncharacterized UBP type Zn finger protein
MEFDEFLDLKELLEQEDEEESVALLYRLLSVVVHHGNSIGCGRYFSFVRCNGGDQWGRFWGTDVQPVDWETIQKESFGSVQEDEEGTTSIGYMLFYEKIPLA